jgi:hypothetical protein
MALISAVVPLVVALISTLRWPTLRRRIRDHAALLKDLPPEAAQPLQKLLVHEVELLVSRDAPLLSSKNVVLRLFHRAKFTAVFAFLLTVYVLMAVNWASDEVAGLGGISVPLRIVLVLAGVTASLYAAEWSFRTGKRSRRPAVPSSDE